MRIECPACNESCDAELVRASTQSATFACEGCGEETTETVARIAKLAAATQVVDVDNPCPKCAKPVTVGAESCASCGLAVDKFAAYSGNGPAAAPELVSAWGRAEANWQDGNVHEDFVAEVSLSGNYRAGALWYRQASADPERAAKALEMLDRVQAMATAALMSSKPKIEDEKEPYRNVVILLMVMLFLAAGVGIILMNGGDGKRKPAETQQYEPSFMPRTRGPAERPTTRSRTGRTPAPTRARSGAQ